MKSNLNEEVIFDKFDWSGENSHVARIKASERLAKQLQKSFESNHDKKHIVIAHSHGGNLTLYALKAFDKLPLNFKLVTLATPYINAKITDSETSFKALNWTITIMAFLACFGILMSIFNVNGSFTELPFWITIIHLVVPYLMASLVYQQIRKYFEKAKIKSLNFYDKVSFKGIPKTKILSVVIKGDEAFNWLNYIIKPSQLFHFSHRSTWVSLTMFRNTFLSYSFIPLVVVGVGILALKDVFDVDFTQVLGTGISAWSTIVSWVFVYGIFFGVIMILFSFPMTLIFSSNPGIFGWSSLFDMLYLNIYPTKNLSDDFSADVETYEKSIKQSKGLFHSQPYISPTIIKNISTWITIY